ncbi:ABC transporter ATP-binding protein [Rhizobium sp. VS19-DR104.2]|uniref:ABC transporter ATP-binding protein n=1 Tax=unclassified Rhizobium TaxID=2613769 RepID=UPI001C5AA22F|nr:MULTISPECIES: ABC transporter ATP-binding protein [unclassified Rhizobium]MBZ5761212.1 ABC transporter ATP-binding protein [Rhizobium sp. VS19-DR96]MBZ5766966.1 ABC transporter ATP-binding protein [Rhizobium sp. VS19-DR129.2]MBZ5774851.1 ABC transporter ATP-binding protein [Rhizobium sp. VS19-DRK62.2]MBZ5785644.1 ABC transporter ATP-binding protein [Rhizobium sp. VS19-DR121]MBZ5803070.1 ABC transporter ATP-binding protein [Rhizobium sp. VS19-DR181]
MAISIQIDHVSREYGPVKALDDVTLEIKAGEFFTLLGSSGCGKSSLLKLIGGFDRQTSGRVAFDGKDVGDVPANRRPVNTVFQNLALFPHMTVAQNIGYGLRLKGMSNAELQAKVDDALDLVELSGFGPRDVNLLSGGQRQRVALARALVMEPGILLLDEPLTGLDERLRQQMRDEFGRLHKRTGATFILVTHNQDEALSLSDRMAVMHRGRIEQVDVPARFFETPANAFVARFVGIDTVLRPEAVMSVGDHAQATVAGQTMPVRMAGPLDPTASVVAIRPDRLFVAPSGASPSLRLTVVGTTFRGLHRDLKLAFADGQTLMIAIDADSADLAIGQEVSVGLKPDAAVLIAS